MSSPAITFRPLDASTLAQLEAVPWSSGLKAKHGQRLARQQEGEVSYLVAWQATTPIGHLLLKYSGPADRAVATQITECAEIEDFVIRPDLRSQGIGREMIETAARLTRERGLQRLGLAVGHDNPRARSLYERSGFVVSTDCGTITVRWQGPGKDGTTRWFAQECVYLVRELS